MISSKIYQTLFVIKNTIKIKLSDLNVNLLKTLNLIFLVEIRKKVFIRQKSVKLLCLQKDINVLK